MEYLIAVDIINTTHYTNTISNFKLISGMSSHNKLVLSLRKMYSNIFSVLKQQIIIYGGFCNFEMGFNGVLPKRMKNKLFLLDDHLICN